MVWQSGLFFAIPRVGGCVRTPRTPPAYGLPWVTVNRCATRFYHSYSTTSLTGDNSAVLVVSSLLSLMMYQVDGVQAETAGFRIYDLTTTASFLSVLTCFLQLNSRMCERFLFAPPPVFPVEPRREPGDEATGNQSTLSCTLTRPSFSSFFDQFSPFSLQRVVFGKLKQSDSITGALRAVMISYALLPIMSWLQYKLYTRISL